LNPHPSKKILVNPPSPPKKIPGYATGDSKKFETVCCNITIPFAVKSYIKQPEQNSLRLKMSVYSKSESEHKEARAVK
jgi:hypothetical protein